MYNTRCTQVYEFVDLYKGPEYILHFRYAYILNIVYVTMLYGVGLPILFPIAMLAIFLTWATERYQLAYTY